MNTSSAIWHNLRKSKKYREEFVAAHVKRAIPHQARALMKAKGMTQEQLAHIAGLSQGVVSRAVDPSNGNLTLNTIIRIAAGLDVAFVGQFVPFSELAQWYLDLPNRNQKIPSFEEEDQAIAARESQEAKPLLELTTGLPEEKPAPVAPEAFSLLMDNLRKAVAPLMKIELSAYQGLENIGSSLQQIPGSLPNYAQPWLSVFQEAASQVSRIPPRPVATSATAQVVKNAPSPAANKAIPYKPMNPAVVGAENELRRSA